MATQWNRQPTGDEESISEDGKTGAVRWVAAGYLTTTQALAASDFPVARNDPHPDDPSGPLRCDSFRIVASGFRVMSVDARYSIPPGNSGEHPPNEPDVSNPLVFSWSTIQESVKIDRDRDGNPILTAVGRHVPGVQRTLNYKRLTITRWEASYNLAQAQAFENTVNSSTFEGGAARSVKCSIIQPSASYDALTVLIPIDYVFDYKAPAIWGEHPHQTWVLHQDSYAFSSPGGVLRRIVTASGESVTDALLDAQGVPLDSSLTYFENAGDDEPAEDPEWVTQSLPTGATAVTQGAAVFLRYNTLPETEDRKSVV